MPARFPKPGRPVRKGRPAKHISQHILNYRGYKIEYEFYELAELYLVSIYQSLLTKQPSFEFLLSPQDLGGQGVETYLVIFIDELQSYLENDPIKEEISRLYNVPVDSISDIQKAAFIRTKEIVK